MLNAIVVAASLQGRNLENFEEGLLDWESLIEKYEDDMKDEVSERVKRSVLLKHAPAEIQSQLQVNGSTVRDYDAMRAVVINYLDNKKVWSGNDPNGIAPIDVGAVTGKPGKGKDGTGKTLAMTTLVMSS